MWLVLVFCMRNNLVCSRDAKDGSDLPGVRTYAGTGRTLSYYPTRFGFCICYTVRRGSTQLEEGKFGAPSGSGIDAPTTCVDRPAQDAANVMAAGGTTIEYDVKHSKNIRADKGLIKK
jgi:hypothetical protein